MTLPASNQIAMSQVNTEINRVSTQQISLSDSTVRFLANILTGTISMSSLYGKTYTSAINYLIVGGSGAPDSWSGGGGGGVIADTANISLSTTYTVVVGGQGQSSSFNGRNMAHT